MHGLKFFWILYLLIIVATDNSVKGLSLSGKMDFLTRSMTPESLKALLDSASLTFYNLKLLSSIVSYDYLDLKSYYEMSEPSIEKCQMIVKLVPNLVNFLLPMRKIYNHDGALGFFLDNLKGPLGERIIVFTETVQIEHVDVGQRLSLLEHVVKNQQNLIESTDYCYSIFSGLEKSNSSDNGNDYNGFSQFFTGDLWQLFDTCCIEQILRWNSFTFLEDLIERLINLTDQNNYSVLYLIRLANLFLVISTKQPADEEGKDHHQHQHQHHPFNSQNLQLYLLRIPIDPAISRALLTWSDNTNSNNSLLSKHGQTKKDAFIILSGALRDLVKGNKIVDRILLATIEYELAIISVTNEVPLEFQIGYVIELMGRYCPKEVRPYQSRLALDIFTKVKLKEAFKNGNLEKWRIAWMEKSFSLHFPPHLRSSSVSFSEWRRKVLQLGRSSINGGSRSGSRRDWGRGSGINSSGRETINSTGIESTGRASINNTSRDSINSTTPPTPTSTIPTPTPSTPSAIGTSYGQLLPSSTVHYYLLRARVIPYNFKIPSQRPPYYDGIYLTDLVKDLSKKILETGSIVRLNKEGFILFNCGGDDDDQRKSQELLLFWYGRIVSLATDKTPLPIIYNGFFKNPIVSTVEFSKYCFDSTSSTGIINGYLGIAKITLNILERFKVPEMFSYPYKSF